MFQENELSPAEREMEAALRSLVPSSARIDSVATAFAAGRRSARRELTLWRGAAAIVLLLSIGSRLIPSGKEQPLAGKPPRPTTVVATMTPMPPISEQSMVMLRRAIGERGIEGLSPVQLSPVKTINEHELNSIHRGES